MKISALEACACSRRCAIQIDNFFLPLLYLTVDYTFASYDFVYCLVVFCMSVRTFDSFVAYGVIHMCFD